MSIAQLLSARIAAVAVAMALAGCGGGDGVMPAGGNAATGTSDPPPAQTMTLTIPRQSVTVSMPRAGALSAASSGTANVRFENGMADWTNWGNAQVVAGVGIAGSSAMEIGPDAGGAALNVPGVVPGTAYRLTVQLKVDDPSQTPQWAYGGTGPFVGVNMLDPAGNKVVIEGVTRSQRGEKTADGWVLVTMDFVAPSNAATAVIWVWKNAGNLGYMDDVVFGPANFGPPPVPGNMIANGGFESGMAGWSDWGNSQVIGGAGTSGSNALLVGTGGAGGAAYRVNGLVAGTTYRLTARLKVSDASETVFVGVNMLTPSGSGLSPRPGPVSSTGYVTVTVDMVAPAGSTSADVYVWKNAGTGYGYVDDVSFAPVDATPPPASSNLLTNGGFESGMQDWVSWGNAVPASGEGSSGTWGLRVGTAAGGAGHDVGVVAGTTYRFTAQARVSAASETVYVGVNILDASGAAFAQKSMPITSTAYSTASFDIVAPANAAKAVVYVWKDAGSGFAYVDDFVFQVADGSAPPQPPPPTNLLANGGFENGLASWVNWDNTTAATGQAAAGSYAAQVGTAAGGSGQYVGGVVAGNSYRASAQVKVSSPAELGYFGLKFTDDAGTVLREQHVTFNSTAYSTAQIQLAAPAGATRAMVYVWKDAGAGFAYVDEVALVQTVRIVALSVTPELVKPAESGRQFSSPAMVRLTGGGYVIAWAAVPATNGAGTGDMCFHRYDATGASAGPAACVAGAHSSAGGPWVVARRDGGFTIMWNEANNSADPSGLRWQDYDQGGNAQGAIQSGPLPIWLSAQPLVGGGYVKLGVENGAPVAFQLYAADGTPIGQPQPVSDVAGLVGGVTGLAGGGFAVAWVQKDGAPTVAMTRAFSADGRPLGQPVAIAPNTLGAISCGKGGGICPPYQNVNAITATADGGYIVTWNDGTGVGTPGGSFARQFRADGSPASLVVGRIGNGSIGPVVAVSPDSFVMAVSDSGASSISALHVGAVPLR